MSLNPQLSSKLSKRQRVVAFTTIAVVLVIAGFFLLRSHAAQPAIAIEAESFTPNGTAQIVSDPTASDGKAIQFKTATTLPEAYHTCYPDAFCNSANQAVIMNGVNIRYVGGGNLSLVSLAQMQKIKVKGFNSARFAMDWRVFQPSAGVGGFSSKAFDNLKTAVDNATAAGINVILDPIHFGQNGDNCGTSGTSKLCIPSWARVSSGGTYQGSVTSVKTNAKDYIEKIASTYASNPTVVAIDLTNEPKPEPAGGDELIVSMYNTLIGWARAKDSDKILMIEPDSGGKKASLSALKTLTRKDNVVYSFHDYFGGAHNSSGTLISGCSAGGYSSSGFDNCGYRTYESGAGYPQIRPDDLKATIKENKAVLDDPAIQLPLWIGEYGIIDGGAHPDQWRIDITAAFKEYKLGRAYWQYANTTNDPASSNMSMTVEGSDTPGAFKSWVSQLF